MTKVFMRPLLALFLLTGIARAQTSEIAPLPTIAPEEVERLSVSDLDARASKGDAKAQAELGARYARGDGASVDLAKAIALFESAARKKDANAQYYLGTAYSTGIGVTKDDKRAAQWFRRAADQGHAGGQYSFGVMLAAGDGGLKADPAAAATYVRKSADQGFIQAAWRMAQLHIAGLGVERDTEQAAHWYRRILKTTAHLPSQAGLIVLLETGEAKWREGDPIARPAADAPQPVQQADAVPVAPHPPARPKVVIPPEEPATVRFNTPEGPTIEARTQAGRLTLFSIASSPFQCRLEVDFTYLNSEGVREKGGWVCFSVVYKSPGEKVEACDLSNANFVHTKVESVKLSRCAPPPPGQ